jgi:hypothetical protein
VLLHSSALPVLVSWGGGTKCTRTDTPMHSEWCNIRHGWISTACQSWCDIDAKLDQIIVQIYKYSKFPKSHVNCDLRRQSANGLRVMHIFYAGWREIYPNSMHVIRDNDKSNDFSWFCCAFDKGTPQDPKVPTAIPHKVPRTRFPPPHKVVTLFLRAPFVATPVWRTAIYVAI